MSDKKNIKLLTEDENSELGNYLRRKLWQGEPLSGSELSRLDKLLDKKAKEDFLNFWASEENPEFEPLRDHLRAKIERDVFP